MKKIRDQIEAGFDEIQSVIDTSSLTDLRNNVMSAIDRARADVNERMNEFEEANAIADQFVDSHLEKATQSKWTALIVAAGTLIAVSVGVVIGMHL